MSNSQYTISTNLTVDRKSIHISDSEKVWDFQLPFLPFPFQSSKKDRIWCSANLVNIMDIFQNNSCPSPEVSSDEGLDISANNFSFKTSVIFNDMVHPHLELPTLCYKIINTKQFQRLRNLKQLGLCYSVYPSASHNRFEHCLGTAYLAGKYAKYLQKNQPELGITEKDVLCVQIAGLLHDLGHGPFSHTFEQFMEHYEHTYSHERMSLELIDYLIEDNNLWEYFEAENIEKIDLIFIKEAILGHPIDSEEFQGRDDDKYFLYQIVSNEETKIDVDKFDYLLRDCKMLSLQNAFDYERLIDNSRVFPVEDKNGKMLKKIVYRKKIVDNLKELFIARSRLHTIAYQHRVTRTIERMVVEGLIEANLHFEIFGDNGIKWSLATAHKDVTAFMKLTDSIFESILYFGSGGEKAQKIFTKIVNRELYKHVGYLTIKPEGDVLNELTKIDPNITLVETKINYGKGPLENPLNNSLFFEKSRPNHVFQLKFPPPPSESKCYIVLKSPVEVTNSSKIIEPQLELKCTTKKIQLWAKKHNLTLQYE